MTHDGVREGVSRRAVLAGLMACAVGGEAKADDFPAFLARFKARAIARGVSEATYARVIAGLTPDPEVLELSQRQAEFSESTWQYLSRRVSDWRITTGREKIREHADVLARIEQRYGVDRYAVVSVWGNETSYGEIFRNPRYTRPVLRSLATLAWREPRRRSYWEQEFANALVIVERGWARPEQMTGSWAGAMGHTQFMPEAWLNASADFDGDGRRNLFEVPDALASTANFLKTRGRWQTGRPWGYEVRVPESVSGAQTNGAVVKSLSRWAAAGVRRADGQPLTGADDARLRLPAGHEGPGFLTMQNFRAFMAYNPSFNYALSVAHLADRLRGDGPFRTPWPGAERQLTLAEVQELQQRLTARGLDTGGTTGAVGDMTRRAVRDFQQRAGMTPADGWPSERVLQRLRAAP
jgi:lytic murein transglycosylase